MDSEKRSLKKAKHRKLKKACNKVLKTDQKKRKVQSAGSNISGGTDKIKKRKVVKTKLKAKAPKDTATSSKPAATIPPQKTTVARATALSTRPNINTNSLLKPVKTLYPDIPDSVVKKIKKPISAEVQLEKLKKQLVTEVERIQEELSGNQSPLSLQQNSRTPKTSNLLSSPTKKVPDTKKPTTAKTVKTLKTVRKIKKSPTKLR